MEGYTPWWEKRATFREKKAVIKLYDDDNSFLTSVHIPSNYWPLNGAYEVFTYANTYCIEDDEEAISLFNQQIYQIGHCYQNTKNIAKAFRDAGYDIKTYCGWAFIHEQTPIHHCWAVLTDEDGHKAVLDLSCDNYKMTQWFSQKDAETPNWFTSDRAIDCLTEWVKYSRKELTHAERCFPCGVIPPTHLYVGSECDPDEGIVLYRKVTAQYPRHMCERKTNSAGYNKTQWTLKQHGLID